MFNLHAGKFISAVSNALPGTVARLTAINLGNLGASASDFRQQLVHYSNYSGGLRMVYFVI